MPPNAATFSNGNGKVAVSWTITGKGGNKRLKFKWRENGGPPIVAPTHHGFGTSLLKPAFADVRVEFGFI
jgi:two-component sensor histidine kinase